MQEQFLADMQKTFIAKVAEELEEYVKCVRQLMEEQRKKILEIASEIKDALQRIAEMDKELLGLQELYSAYERLLSPSS